MKKTISAIAAAAILSTAVFGQCVSADVEGLQLGTAKSAAEDFVSRYYYSMYTDSEIDLYGRSAYEEMADYLSAKLKYQQSICGDVVNYKVYTYTESFEESENAYLFNVVSAVEFNYIDADFDSGFTAGNQVMVEKGGECKILDVMIGGGVNDSLLGREELDLDNCFWENENVTKEAIGEVCDYIDEVMQEEKIQAEAAVNDMTETYAANAFTSNLTNTQRQRIAQYAAENTRILLPEENNGIVGQEITPKSAISGVNYFDFSNFYDYEHPDNEEKWNYDCTNFTSHCLIAGGAIRVYPSNKDEDELGIESTGWFYNNTEQRSNSWSSVNSFYDFVTTNTGKGPKAEEWNVYSSSERKLVNCAIGDIIQINYDGIGKYDHNVVISGVARSNKDGKYWPAVTGRSGSRYFEINRPEYCATRALCLTECKQEIKSGVTTYRVLRLTSLT